MMKTKVSDIRTEAYQYPDLDPFSCVLCGSIQDHGFAAIKLIEDGENVGDVCPACAAAGVEGARQRVLEYVDSMKLRRKTLLDYGGRLAAATSWATVNDLREAEEEAGLALKAGIHMGDPNHQKPTEDLMARKVERQRQATGRK